MNAQVPSDRVVSELIGVYNADGGLIGEARYLIGSLTGKAHCALCDITHSPIRRKREWDEMVTSLGVPFSLDHLNEMPPDVAAMVSHEEPPIVAARLATGGLQLLLTATQLESVGGSVAQFQVSLRDALARENLRLVTA